MAVVAPHSMHPVEEASTAGQLEHGSQLAVAIHAADTATVTATVAQSSTDQQQPLAGNVQCSAEQQFGLTGSAAQHTASTECNAASPVAEWRQQQQHQQPCSVHAAAAALSAAYKGPTQSGSTSTAAATQQLPLAPSPAVAAPSAKVQPSIPHLPRSNSSQRLGGLLAPRGSSASSGARLGGLSSSTGRLGSLAGSSSGVVGSGSSGGRLGGLSTPNRRMGLASPTGSSIGAFAKLQYNSVQHPANGGGSRRLQGLASPSGMTSGGSSSLNTSSRRTSGSFSGPPLSFHGSAKPLFGAQAGFSNGPHSGAPIAGAGRGSNAFQHFEPILRSSGSGDFAAAAVDMSVAGMAQQQQLASVRHCSRSPSPQLPPLAAGAAAALAAEFATTLPVSSSAVSERSPSPAPAGSVGAAAAARCWSPALPPHSGSSSGAVKDNSTDDTVAAYDLQATAVADSTSVPWFCTGVVQAAAATPDGASVGLLALSSPAAATAAGMAEAAGQFVKQRGVAGAAAAATSGAPALQSSLRKRTPEVQVAACQIKKVRFNDRVQVFVLPPPPPKQRSSRSKKGGSKAAMVEEATTAAAAAANEVVPDSFGVAAEAAEQQQLAALSSQSAQQQQGQWVAARYAPELSWRKFRRYKKMAQSGDDACSDPTVADAVATVAAMEAEKQAEAAAAAAASNSASGEDDDTEDAEALVASLEGPKKRKKPRLGEARKRNPAVAAAAAAVDSVDPEELEECYRDAAGNGVWSLWHDNPQTIAPLKKGSAHAAAVEAMLAEEGLDPKTAAAVMGHVYKEKKAPGVAVIRGRIQRFKAVIAPYRRPSMLLWLRKCPRLINNAEATLSAQVSQMLALFSPGLMLPSQAAELLDKCPQLAARTATVTKTKIDLFTELFGREAVPPLLLRFPVILTMSTERIKETVALVREMLAADNEYSKLLTSTLRGSFEASKDGKLTGRPAEATAEAVGATLNGAAVAVSDVQGEELPAQGLPVAAAAAVTAAPAEDILLAAALRRVKAEPSTELAAEGLPATAATAMEADPCSAAASKTGDASIAVQEQQQQPDVTSQGQQQQQAEVTMELVHHLLLLYPAFFIHQPTRVREHYVKYQAMQQFWNTGTGSVTGILAPLMLPDWHFALLEDRVAYLQATGQADKAQGSSCHGLSSPAFNSRFPDFPAWREQQRGVPISTTQTEFPHKKCNKKRKTQSAAATKAAAASGGKKARRGSGSSNDGRQQPQAGKKRSRTAAASHTSDDDEEEWQSDGETTDGSEDVDAWQEQQQQAKEQQHKMRRTTRQRQKILQQQEEEEEDQTGRTPLADAVVVGLCRMDCEGQLALQHQQPQQPALACRKQQLSLVETESEERGSGESELSGFVGEECEQQGAMAAAADGMSGLPPALASVATAGSVAGMQQQTEWLQSMAQEMRVMQQALQ